MPDITFFNFRDMMAVDPIEGFSADGTADPDGLIAYQFQKRKRFHTEDYDDEVNESLSIAQRVKRRLIFKRNAAKIRLGRERASKRRASTDVLKKRAFMMAKSRLATKLLGGRAKGEVGSAEKSRVEALLQKRKKSIARVALKLLPMVRKRDQDKFKSKSSAIHHAPTASTSATPTPH